MGFDASCRYGGCAWETFGSAGGDSSWYANPRTVANTARIMVQDVADVFTVMERRGFDSPAVS